MRITKILLVCLCCLMGVSAVWGQTADAQSKVGILGYLDPKTGAFRPVPQVSNDSIEPELTFTSFTGTITVTLTITVKSTGLTTFICSASTGTGDVASGKSYSEGVTAAATGTGTTRTCKLTIPYEWSLASQASDSMITSYTVIGTAGTTVTPSRTSDLINLDSRKVPASGATTALTAAVTL
jgi:hypothetical protein